MEELELGRGIDHHEPVRLGDLGGDLRQVLGPRHPDRNRKTEFLPDPLPNRFADLGRSAE